MCNTIVVVYHDLEGRCNFSLSLVQTLNILCNIAITYSLHVICIVCNLKGRILKQGRILRRFNLNTFSFRLHIFYNIITKKEIISTNCDTKIAVLVTQNIAFLLFFTVAFASCYYKFYAHILYIYINIIQSYVYTRISVISSSFFIRRLKRATQCLTK